MARLACRCLNVSIFATGDWKANPIPASKLFSQGFESKTLYEVNLDVAGIVVVSYDQAKN